MGYFLSIIVTSGRRLEPVSYTHLDVYKRQTSDQAQEVCGAIRECVAEIYDQATACLLYTSFQMQPL